MSAAEILVLVVGIILFCGLVFLRSLRLDSFPQSRYELERQARSGDKAAQKTLIDEELLPGIRAFRYVMSTFFIVFLVVLSVVGLGWLGLIVGFVLVLAVDVLARQKLIVALSEKAYRRFHVTITKVTRKLQPALKLTPDHYYVKPPDFSFSSKEELANLIAEATTVLSQDERNLLKHTLQFEDKRVAEVMTPRAKIETVGAKEILGPVTLDRLHKTGHRQFPVIGKDLDRVLGLLVVDELFSLARDPGKTIAQKLMQTRVCYVNQNQTLASALADFLRSRQHLFIVVNEQEQTQGVITLSDIISSLIGRQPEAQLEFDQYEDLRAVAQRVAEARHKSEPNTHIK